METSRTFLRELTGEDSQFFLDLVNSKGWLENIGDRNLRTVNDARSYLEDKVIKHYKEHGYGMWIVIDKSKGQPIGVCGLFRRAVLEHPDVGFAFSPECQGKGYATEAVVATVEYAFKVLGMSALCAIVIDKNLASKKVLGKSGFAFERAVKIDNELLDLYTLSA